MKIINIFIYHLKTKKKLPLKPFPTFFKEGFVFIKLNTDYDIYGYGEPSPYITSPQKSSASLPLRPGTAGLVSYMPLADY